MKRLIRHICTHGEAGQLYAVGGLCHGHRITSIVDTDKCGQMARVPWYLVTLDNGDTVEVNGSFVDNVYKEDGDR